MTKVIKVFGKDIEIEQKVIDLWEETEGELIPERAEPLQLP